MQENNSNEIVTPREPKGINVLSLCDGMSCGQIALTELGIKVNKYYASEIDKNAIKVTMSNFPDTIQLGDVTQLTTEVCDGLEAIDLVLFGSPCRSLSKATAGRKDYNNGLDGASWIFYPCADILHNIKIKNPNVKFLVENVDSDKKDDLAEISESLGVQPVMINSNLFSAQDRKRNYWTNIIIDEIPLNNDSVLENVLDESIEEKYFYDKDFVYHGDDKKVCATVGVSGHDILKRVNNKKFKAPTLTSCRGGNTQKKVFDNGRCRKLTPSEYRKLQTIPDWYKMEVADSHIYNMCGDGWTIEVIKHILKNL